MLILRTFVLFALLLRAHRVKQDFTAEYPNKKVMFWLVVTLKDSHLHQDTACAALTFMFFLS